MVNGKAAYELKGRFLDDLRENAFSGTNGEDVVMGTDANMEYDPSNVEFVEWLALKFYNHKTMDRYTMNALCVYWARGDDEVELTDEEFSHPDDKNLIDKEEVAEIFSIETDIFDFETPLCIAFDEFNYLLKVDTKLFTHDI
ncbi:hypothetical protein Tco_0024420 [Tanacetum coccineum]